MRISFDDNWRFHLGDHAVPRARNAGHLKAGYARGYAAPDAPDASWETLRLPHDWMVGMEPVPWEEGDQGFYPRGIGWYRKAFDIPEAWLGKKLYLEFEGIFRNSTVYLNGFDLGTHAGGYTPVIRDITDFVPRWKIQECDDPRPNATREILAVRVDATQPEGWWYDGAGIYRHAWLHVLDRLHFDIHGLWCETTDCAAGRAHILLHTQIRNTHDAVRSATIRARVLAPDGNTVLEITHDAQCAEGETQLAIPMSVDAPRLWSPDCPNLYHVDVTLEAGGTVLETRTIPLGIRSFCFDATDGFFLNGAPLKIQGVNAHQDFAAVGVALPDRLHEKRVELAKELGANAFRCAHNPPAPALLDACDRLGLLVIDENRHLPVNDALAEDLDRMVIRDRKHPSVIAWSLCNEEFCATRPLAASILRTAAGRVRALDPSRPVTFAGNNFLDNGTRGVCWQQVDLEGRNYGWNAYDAEHARRLEHPALSTEFSALRETRDTYCTDGRYSVAAPRDVAICNSSITDGGLAKNLRDLAAHWKAIAERPFMAGGFLWALMDFRGENGWPRLHSDFGVLDLCGFPKDSGHAMRAWWRPETAQVHLLPHWTWPDHEGLIQVRAVTNCEEVELRVNGISYGRQDTREYGLTEWPVMYAPGRIEAIGYRNGVAVACDTKRTSGAPARIELMADRMTLIGNGRDVVCVTVSLVDADGTVVPHDDRVLTWRARGAGRLLGLGNGDPCDGTPDTSPTRGTFRGRCLAVCEAAPSEGILEIEAECDGMTPATIRVSVLTIDSASHSGSCT